MACSLRRGPSLASLWFPAALIVLLLCDVDDGANVVIQARLSDVRDSFPLDDEAWLIAGAVRKARGLIVTPGNEILRDFFDHKAMKKVVNIPYLSPADLRDEAKYRGPARNGAYDLIFFDRCASEDEDDMPPANTFFIADLPPPWKRTAMPPLMDVQIRNSIEILRPDAAVQAIEFVGPGRQRETAARGVGGDFSYKNTENIGVYGATGTSGRRLFVVNLLDADESNIRPRDAIQIGVQRLAAGPVRQQTYDTWQWIALAALVLLVLEWAAYHARPRFHAPRGKAKF